MNCGKVSETVFDRTVYKTIKTIGYNDGVTDNSAGLGTDCAILPFSDSDKKVITAQGYASGKEQTVAVRAILQALNKCAANGCTAKSGHIVLHITIPSQLREAKLRGMLELASQLSAEEKLPIVNCDVYIEAGIQTVMANAFVTLEISKNDKLIKNKALPEQDVVMTKWMGLEGTSILTAVKLAELEKRYPLNLLEDAKNFSKYLSIIPEAAIAAMSDVSAMQAVREGGVFGALWELAQGSDVGLVIDLKKIPVKQETIEVCEFFDINPYKLLSGGSLLITTDKGMNLVSKLQQQGIAATVIGKTTDSNDRIIINDDETRYLELPREDSLYDVFSEKEDQ